MVDDAPEMSQVYDMQLIGSFLSCASRGDKVGLNQMLREGISPDVQDYDKRTALHLAASEGHASVVELLLEYKASVNLEDRWQRTPLTDAKLYGHGDICRILEVNGGSDSSEDHPLTFPHEQGLNEVNIDLSELDLEHSLRINQGIFGTSEKVKWRGTWVVKTIIKTQISLTETMILSAKEMSLLRELRHPNILQFLGAIVDGEEMILITEYLSKGSLFDILARKVRFDIITSLRYALDIAKGMNYLHQHKPNPIVHNNLCSRNLFQDEGGHLKIGDYWVQMLYEQIHPYQENSCNLAEKLVNYERNDSSGIVCNSLYGTKKDMYSFALVFYEMLEGRELFPTMDSDTADLKSTRFEPKFKLSRCPTRIQQLIRDCVQPDLYKRPKFAKVIEILEEVSKGLVRSSCLVC